MWTRDAASRPAWASPFRAGARLAHASAHARRPAQHQIGGLAADALRDLPTALLDQLPGGLPAQAWKGSGDHESEAIQRPGLLFLSSLSLWPDACGFQLAQDLEIRGPGKPVYN